MKKMIVSSSVLIALLLTTSVAFAVPGGGRGAGYCNGAGQWGQAMTYEQHKTRIDNRLERMGVVLDLSDQQKSQIRTIMDQQWKKQQGARAEMQASRAALQDARRSGTFNEKEVRAQARKHADLKVDRMVERNAVRQQVLAVLTPEQQKKMEQMRSTMPGAGRHNGMGAGKRGGLMGTNW